MACYVVHNIAGRFGSDQSVLGDCLKALGELHEALDDAEHRHPGRRTLVRDGGSWSEQLELDLDVEGYYSLISLPLSHSASQWALEQAAQRGAMKPWGGKLGEVRAARLRNRVGETDDGLRLDCDQDAGPAGPEVPESCPEDPVQGFDYRPRTFPLEDGELLSQGKDFEGSAASTAGEDAKCGEERDQGATDTSVPGT